MNSLKALASIFMLVCFYHQVEGFMPQVERLKPQIEGFNPQVKVFIPRARGPQVERLNSQAEGFNSQVEGNGNIYTDECHGFHAQISQLPQASEDEKAKIIEAVYGSINFVKSISTGLNTNYLTNNLCKIAKDFFQNVKTDYPRVKKANVTEVFIHVFLPAWVRNTLMTSRRRRFYGWGG